MLNLDGQKFLFPNLACQCCEKETLNAGLCDSCAEAWCRSLVVE